MDKMLRRCPVQVLQLKLHVQDEITVTVTDIYLYSAVYNTIGQKHFTQYKTYLKWISDISQNTF